ncbi:Signal recognition particle subunit SRP72 [Linum grandiflorum]
MAPKPRDKAKPSPAASQPPPAIEDLFTKLNSHIEGSSDPNIEQSELEKAVRVADQVLSIAPGDEDAIRCKVVALIKNDSYDNALSAIRSASKLQLDFSFEQAYCLYKQNKLDEGLELLKGQEKNDETMLLEAQILFRLGRMDACIDVYQKLRKSKLDSLEINLAASLILAGRSSEVQGMLEAQRIKPSSSYDLAFNTACSLIEVKKYAEAEQLLQEARRIGQESLLDSNWAEEDIEIELAPISVQLAYVSQLLGRSQEAMEAYAEIISPNLADDLSSLAVAANNLVAVRGPKEVSDSLKKLDLLKEQGAAEYRLARGLEKLSPKQRETIYTNRVLLLLHANKMDQARELVSALPEMFADSEMPVLLQAAVLVREKKAAKAEELLDHCATKFPHKSKIALLARAQIAAASGHHQIAADSLSRIPDIQHLPATVATLVALKERAGDIDGASAVLDSAVKWWSNSMTDEDSKLNIIMQEAASFKVRHGRGEEAARLYEELVRSHESVDAIVGLVSTIARVDIDKAELYKKKLNPLPGLKSIDVDSLEKTSGAKHTEGASLPALNKDEDGKKEKQKKKRKRKPRYPKGFDPANPGPPPDPERWLPKRERSSYRPKRKDKRAAQVRGSQGAVSRDNKNEASAAAAVTSSNVTKAAAGGVKASAQNAGPSSSKQSSKSSKKKSRR